MQAILHKVAPALAAGCTIVIKPSPETPLEAYILAEAAQAAGLPPGVLNVAIADRLASEHLVRNPKIDKVAFTGSSSAGKRIASICGERVARVTLELGGKSAAVLLDDYDIEIAAENLTGTACRLSGQGCSNLTRILVPREKHDRFVDAFVRQMKGIRVGNPYEEGTQMGPVAMKRQYDRILNYVEIGKGVGAELVLGGGRPPGLDVGHYIAPTIFSRVNNSSLIAQEEIFGPVICVTPYQNLDEAIHFANDTPFGLSGGVFTNDVDRAYAVARAMCRFRRIPPGHSDLMPPTIPI